MLLLASLNTVAQPFAPAEVGTTLSGFQDDFNGASLGANWTVAGANVFSVAAGMLHVGNATGDPNHLLYTAPGYQGTVQEVLVRMRVTRFGNGAYARGGVTVTADVASRQGINLSFRDNDGAGNAFRHTRLLDDYRAWGPLQSFAWQTNTWYWLRLRQEPNAAAQGGLNDVFAKIWLSDGTAPEPAAWQLAWNYTPGSSTRAGYAGLMAGSSGGGATDFSEFDVDYILIKAAGLPGILVAPAAFSPIPATITNQPQSQTVAELAPVTFSAGARGNPAPTYQWYRNDVPIPDATNTAYSITSVGLSDNGAAFRLVARNVTSGTTHSSTSSVATLTVIADTNPPVLLGARSLGLGLVQAFFSERVTAPSAASLANYALTGPGGTVVLLNAALDATQTNALLTVNPLTEGASYTLTVNGVADQSAAANAISGGVASFVAVQPSVLITEFVADNTLGLTDADGDHSDWIELQNRSAFVVDLAGWRLTDNPTNLALWSFPSRALQPGEFTVVFASGKDRRLAGAELHTNFRLDAGGEYLAIVRPDGSIAHQLTFGLQHRNASFGAVGNTNLFMITPTPGAANGPGVFGFVADTKVTPNRGFFTTNFSLSITTATAGAEIWFTTDGGVPAPGAVGSSRYTAPFVISNTTTLRAAAFLTGYGPTDVDTHTYLSVASTARQPANPSGFPTSWAGYSADYEMDPQIVTATPPGYDITNALLSLPAVSLVASRDDLFGAVRGIYANSEQQGDGWEREASVEWILPDGTPGFQYEAGLRIHGYTSRSHGMTLKHSIRIAFRNRYGPSRLHYPLFPDTGANDFDQLVLRACSTDSYAAVEWGGRWQVSRATYMRDQWMRDSLRDLGQLTAHGRYVHLWINGLYWGVYNLAEAVGSGFAAEHLGGGKDEYDVLKDYLLVDNGDLEAWNAATALAMQGFAAEADYQRVQGNNPDGARNTNFPIYLNISNLVDYMLVHITAGAEDWDFNNWWSCRRRGPWSEGFHFCSWDQEISNDSLTRDLTVFGFRYEEVATPDRPSYFYDRLRNTSPSFRQYFIDRVWQVLTSDGPLTPSQNAARWLARQSELDCAIMAEAARWGDARREPPYTREGNWLSEMQWQSSYWAANHTRVVQRFRRVNLWPLLGPPELSQGSGYFNGSATIAITHTNTAGVLWYTTNGLDPRSVTGAPAASARSYSGPITLDLATRLRTRVTDGTNWSPPADATYLPVQALTNLAVTEIYYNPPGAPGVDGESFEFLELQNRGAFALDLGGLRFSSGIVFIFTNGTTLAPGGFFVLARDATNFAARFPEAPLHGLYSGKLNNDGETLALQNAINDTVFTFGYGDTFPWPVAADGIGDSLHRLYFGDPTNAANWCAASPSPGSQAPPRCNDTDHDGLSDEWELLNGLDPDSASGDDGASGDPDQDGVSNLQEFIAGTDPRDSQSYLRIDSISASGGVALAFVAVSNKTYSIEYRNSLNSDSWTNFLDVTGGVSTRIAVIMDTNGMPGRFYRLRTPKQR